MDYDKTFETRGHKYKYATETYPNVLDSEFQTAVAMCELEPGMVLVNIPAACVPLHAYLQSAVADIEYVPLESNRAFAELTGVPYSPLDALDLPDNSADVIVSLASLHHATDAERRAFYGECRRVLRPGGRLVVGDVARGSAQDAWLNTFVDLYNSAGHKGQFWSSADVPLFEECGFSVTLRNASYTWGFRSRPAMLDFCKNLFGLDLATDAQITDGLAQYLKPAPCDDGLKLPWNLMYFIASLPGVGKALPFNPGSQHQTTPNDKFLIK
jgi:SAM-dependent methyltransferase